MSYYIVCQKKRNNPRMDIRICDKKCDMKNECGEYKSYCKELIRENSSLQLSGIEAIQMEAA